MSELVIRLFLRLERNVAAARLQKKQASPVVGRQSSSSRLIVNANDVEQQGSHQDFDDEQQRKSSRFGCTGSIFCYCCNVFECNVVDTMVAFVLIALLAIYYLIHFYVTTPAGKQMETALILEFMMYPVIISFPFCQPLHTASAAATTTYNDHRHNDAYDDDYERGVNNNDIMMMLDNDDDDKTTTTNTTTTTIHNDEKKGQLIFQFLVQDTHTCKLIHLVVYMVFQYSLGEISFFWNLFDLSIGMKCLYAMGVMVKIGVMYFTLLYAMLVARIILIRLNHIEIQIDESSDELSRNLVDEKQQKKRRQKLYHDQPPPPQSIIKTSYETFSTKLEEELLKMKTTTHKLSSKPSTTTTSLEEWMMNQYKDIRHDFHQVCSQTMFGGCMLLVLFLFLVETTAFILTFYEQLLENSNLMTFIPLTCLLISYIANTTVLCATLSYYAYIPTKCQQHIGPKLNIFAMERQRRQEGESDDDENGGGGGGSNSSNSNLDRLAKAFMHAPIRFHLGNFELGSEYANGMILWFIGLFLYVFGFHLPGGGE